MFAHSYTVRRTLQGKTGQATGSRHAIVRPVQAETNNVESCVLTERVGRVYTVVYVVQT